MKKINIKRYIAFVLTLTLLLSFSFAGCSNNKMTEEKLKEIRYEYNLNYHFNDEDEDRVADSKIYKDENLKVKNKNVKIDFMQGTHDVFYKELSQNSKKIYDAFLNAADKERLEVPMQLGGFEDCKYSDAVSAIHALKMDYPLFLLDYKMDSPAINPMSEELSFSDGKAVIHNMYAKDKDGKGIERYDEEYRENLKKVKEKIEKIVSYIPEDATDLEKEKFIFSYLAANVKFTNSIYEVNANNLCGPLLEGIGSIYAMEEAFRVLLDAVGIEHDGKCGVVIDGKEYYCDFRSTKNFEQGSLSEDKVLIYYDKIFNIDRNDAQERGILKYN